MTIWRGEGGGGDATTDSEINFITSLTNSIVDNTAITTAAADATAALYDSFDDRYLGSKAAAPTLDNDSNALIPGALYWNSVSNQMFVWSGTAWQQTFFSGTNVRSIVTATAGQTVVTTPSYTLNNNTIQVYVNGFKVISGTDYTETSTTSITFTSGLTLSDEVEILIAQPFSVGITSSDAANYLPAGTGAVATTVQAKLRESVSVKDFGAVGDGVANDAPAFMLAIKSDRNVLIPPGTYLLNSTVTAPPAAYDNPCVLIQSESNFSVIAYGATINVGNAAARCGVFQFDQCSNFSFEGAKIVGSTSGDKNSAVATSSCENFVISNILIEDMYADGGTAIVGSWIVNGIFDNVIGLNVSTYADHAFAYNVTYKNCTGVGLGSTGVGLGTKGLSIVWDGPNVSNNFTSYTYNNSINVNHINCQMTNFVTGAILASGEGISYIGCNFSDNLGQSASPGIGLYITYYNGGSFSSVGFPAKDIRIIGCQFKNNGATVAQGGILLNPSAITNSDYIENISITGCTFDNNKTQGIGFLTGTNIRYITIIGNTFTGANQTVPIASNLTPLVNYVNSNEAGFNTPVKLRQSLSFNNNIALNWLDTGGTARPVLFVGASNVTIVRPASNLANITFENFAGTQAQFRVSNDANNPIEITVGGGTKQVTVGAADSGGTGFRLLRVAN